MTTFKQFLLEAEGHDLSGFAHNIRVMLDNKIFLYRGTGTIKSSVKIGKGSWDTFTGFIASERTIQRAPKGSKTAARLSSSWEVPNRSLSYFVTRDFDHASRFGNLLLVIPADSVSQYAWSATDFNQGAIEEFKTYFQSIEDATSLILGVLGRDIDRMNTTNFDDMALKILDSTGFTQTETSSLKPDDPKAVKIINKFILYLDKLGNVDSADGPMLRERNLLRALEKIKNRLEKIGVTDVADVYTLANPESFKITTFDSLHKIPEKPETADELWFNGKYLAINLDTKYIAATSPVKILNQLLKEI